MHFTVLNTLRWVLIAQIVQSRNLEKLVAPRLRNTFFIILRARERERERAVYCEREMKDLKSRKSCLGFVFVQLGVTVRNKFQSFNPSLPVHNASAGLRNIQK